MQLQICRHDLRLAVSDPEEQRPERRVLLVAHGEDCVRVSGRGLARAYPRRRVRRASRGATGPKTAPAAATLVGAERIGRARGGESAGQGGRPRRLERRASRRLRARERRPAGSSQQRAAQGAQRARRARRGLMQCRGGSVRGAPTDRAAGQRARGGPRGAELQPCTRTVRAAGRARTARPAAGSRASACPALARAGTLTAAAAAATATSGTPTDKRGLYSDNSSSGIW